MTIEEAKEVLRPLIAMMTDQWGCPISDVPIALEVLLNKVDAEPVRHGKWEVHKAFGYKDMTCSVCGWLYEYYAGLEEEWNYCPHCGCKMDLDEVNDEVN